MQFLQCTVILDSHIEMHQGRSHFFQLSAIDHRFQMMIEMLNCCATQNKYKKHRHLLLSIFFITIYIHCIDLYYKINS